jgi:RNA polymerase sigma-70 factor (ECF subfamily)
VRSELNNDERMNDLFAAHFEPVRAYCLRRLPVNDANDAVAEVFMTAWQKIDQLPGEPGTLPYLYGIARNIVAHSRRSFSRRRRLRLRAGSMTQDRPDDPETLVMLEAERDAVFAALAGLSDADQEVLRLRTWEELTAPQIASVLGVSTAAAEKRLTRATERLRTAVARLDDRFRPHASQGGGER